MFKVSAIFLLLAIHVHGHGYMSEPKSRNYRAFKDVDWQQCLLYPSKECNTPYVPFKEDCPHCMNNNFNTVTSLCGAKQGGGANYDFPETWNGQTLGWKSQAVYQQGSTITVKAILSTFHMGFFEFYACPRSQTQTQACFNQNPLTFVEDKINGAVKDTSYPMRAYASPIAPYLSGEAGGNSYEFLMKLPSNLSGDVFIQWIYYTANSCNPPGYKQYPFPWPNGYNNLQDCATNGSGGERFWNCAEVTITGGPVQTPAPAPVSTPIAVPVAAPTKVPVPAPVTAPTVPNPVGTCGGGNLGNGICSNGMCCSKWGYCGTTADHCKSYTLVCNAY